MLPVEEPGLASPGNEIVYNDIHEIQLTVLEHTTPVILTFNEEANIARTLERLFWADDIVVVDSFSTDATGEIARRFPQVRFFQHTFKSHASQWNFATRETGVMSEWILSLDADYV